MLCDHVKERVERKAEESGRRSVRQMTSVPGTLQVRGHFIKFFIDQHPKTTSLSISKITVLAVMLTVTSEVRFLQCSWSLRFIVNLPAPEVSPGLFFFLGIFHLKCFHIDLQDSVFHMTSRKAELI